YLLFHALVADDRALFERALRWTERHLARGELAANLPAWLWGRDAHGRFRVLDRNSAADADVWMGYALVEAGRVWRAPEHDRLGRALLAEVVRREVRDLPGLGPALLPAPRGFELEAGRAWRLNPSYLPPQVARGLATAGVPGPWPALAAAQRRMLVEASARGFAPDWTLLRDGSFGPDPVGGAVGGYDAIRVYLWNGMLAAGHPERAALLAATAGPAALLAEGREPPERVRLTTGEGQGRAPPGFLAALLPDVLARGDRAAAERLRAGLSAARRGAALLGDPPAYYEQNLALFGEGFAEGRFRFAEDGRLVPAWEEACLAR
ncbi:MAG TPA: cellulose synthase complex periplasmic endoglucanase BcsZ, partial [Anaeromyxobacteraceae bacterium]|nr:cellulose synthase complex periplasmic endoglucanase BcsZ [Anaeromyxobacteraceae bacterium]